ncbi:DUF3307 domain-containing protein [Cytobacillus horneckiae]|uniref:DUF3307 domain-containing protein n=1 Tax=Cytobacillus horneckiae TaxID=549687 RepID=UPI0034CF4D59
MNFLVLFYAHLLADYPLQGEFLAKEKGRNLIVLFSHAGIWTGTILTAAFLLGYNITLLDVASLFIVHAIADYAKANQLFFYKKLNPLTSGLLVDQLIHVLQIVLFMCLKAI